MPADTRGTKINIKLRSTPYVLCFQGVDFLFIKSGENKNNREIIIKN